MIGCLNSAPYGDNRGNRNRESQPAHNPVPPCLEKSFAASLLRVRSKMRRETTSPSPLIASNLLLTSSSTTCCGPRSFAGKWRISSIYLRTLPYCAPMPLCFSAFSAYRKWVCSAASTAANILSMPNQSLPAFATPVVIVANAAVPSVVVIMMTGTASQ
jgi:hypothetical protein